MFSGIGGFEIGIKEAFAEAESEGRSDCSGRASQHEGCSFCGDSEVRRKGWEGVSESRESSRGTNIKQSLSKQSRSREHIRCFGFESDDKVQRSKTEQQEHKPKDCGPICVGFSEVDKYAISIYNHHFPDHKGYGDATKIDPMELPDFDLLCGGFPCQSFSVAGKRKGFQDTRGTLFHEILRIAKAKQPRVLLLENVKGLLSADDGRCFATITSSLDALGYDVEWEVLNSKYFGVPQNRERVFIVGHLRGTGQRQIFPLGKGGGVYDAEQCQDNGEEVSGVLSCGELSQARQGGELHQMNSPTHSNNRIYGSDGCGPSLNTMQGGCRQPKVAIPVISNTVTPDAYLCRGERNRDDDGKAVLTSMCDRRIRRLTPTECERLQGFPDGWTSVVSDTQRYKCLGNAVTTNVIKAVVERMIERGVFGG